MTKPQIWLAAFLLLFIFLFLLGRVTRGPREENKQISNPVPQGEMSNQSQDLSPKDMMTRIGCTGCHGIDLAGTMKAPSLIDIKGNWSKDKLINYLRNPASFMSGDRFKVYREKYSGAMMPSFNNISVQELGKIAEYLLNPQ
jgi:cytochrome c553